MTRASAPRTPQAIPRLITGRRKAASARVRLFPGTGQVRVNGQPVESYFPRGSLIYAIKQPLVATNQGDVFDVVATVRGGGRAGQAGAIRLGIARALVSLDSQHRALLRRLGLLTRDPRARERKKYGQKGARKRFQWTKR